VGQVRVSTLFSWERICSLVILGLCEFARGALLFFILPIYVHATLGLPTDIVGYAIAAHYICDTGLRSLSGWCVDKFGQRITVLSGVMIGWVGLWVIAQAHHQTFVILGSSLLGMGMSSVWPAVISRVTSGLLTDQYATAMSGVMMAWLVGAGGGAVSMGWLLGDSVKRGFGALLGVWLIAIVLVPIVMQGYVHQAHLKQRLRFRDVSREVKTLGLLFPGMFVQTFAMGLLLPVFVLYARFELGLNGQTYSYLLMTAGAATVILQFPIGRFVDKYGYKLFLVTGFGMASLVIPMLIQLQALWEIFVGVCLLGASYALILPSWNSVLAQSVSERQRAVMFGIFMTIEGLGMAVGPLVGGTLWRVVSPVAPFYAASIILLVMSGFYIFAPLQQLFVRARTEQSNRDAYEGMGG